MEMVKKRYANSLNQGTDQRAAMNGLYNKNLADPLPGSTCGTPATRAGPAGADCDAWAEAILPSPHPKATRQD
ncbi:hypothetical protein SKAU_G00055200 [Synaphobranchus kaupii]|uniref:Uncharacterized protein n=1 Tax=Synaphobranchus kaupii TaxID=118154 RepID=A0A9Q1JA63_SYNKA|nr:hypothetical protein SKAU_G00055200 [Synaphobranchus kaupii]